MKKTIFAVTLTVSVLLTGCNSPSQKLEEAKMNAADAQQDLERANTEYLEDMQAYKREITARIAANEQNIQEYKKKAASEKADAKADYNATLDKLEKRNVELKTKLENYKVEGKDQWSSFKAEFTRDMDELGQALKDLTVKNENP